MSAVHLFQSHAMTPEQHPSPSVPRHQLAHASAKARAPVKNEEAVVLALPPHSSTHPSTQHLSTRRPSLLMASAWQRLAVAAGLLAVLWSLVAWALKP